MFFKFVSHRDVAQTESGLVVSYPSNFVVETKEAMYQEAIFWKKDDVPPFSHAGFESYICVGAPPPREEDQYPIEAIVVTVWKEDESRWVMKRYYGFNCDLFVTNDRGTTVDTLRHNPAKPSIWEGTGDARKQVELRPLEPQVEEEDSKD